MKLSQLLFVTLLLASASVATAQRQSSFLSDIDFGVKGGATFTHGYTTIPGQMVGSIQVPDLANKNNGIGYGYSGGCGPEKTSAPFLFRLK